MDLYTTIVGLYSQNRHEVLRVVNTAIHSKCNLSEGKSGALIRIRASSMAFFVYKSDKLYLE